ncbi:MAG TPA: GAF domain-containing sensor histidine kinase [Actinoallomurus sp.]
MATSLHAAARSLAPHGTELRRLAEENRRVVEDHEALRRVATLVARGASPPEVFRTVACETGGLLRADYTAINRYEPDRTVSVLAHWSDPHVPDIPTPFGGRWPMGNDSAPAVVLETGAPARCTMESVTGKIGAWYRSHGITYVVACPIKVEDRLWGAMSILFRGSEPPPEDTEHRMHQFVELVGCTIAQAESRAELIASRARVVASSDAARRRIERDLHDGAQQHLISLALELRATEADLLPEQEELRRRLSTTSQGLSGVLAELQEISHGLHPAILTHGGLETALTALARRSRVPVEFHIHARRRLPEQIEATIYYIVCEALTNVVKHANASVVHVDLTMEDKRFRLSIRDDGHGGAELGRGSGLVGLTDRVAALDGTMQVTSPIGEGTSLLITIPVEHA